MTCFVEGAAALTKIDPDMRPPLERWLGRPIGTRASYRPPLMLAMLYLAAIGVGAMLLMTPFAGGMPWWDALFTAVSAVTVTGLSTVPVHAILTPWGMAVLAVLMQIGGLGLMTFAVLAFRGPAASSSEDGKGDDVAETAFDSSERPIYRLPRIAFRVLIFAATAQAIGTAILAPALISDHGLWGGLGRAAFLAISAFCNSGFTPFANSMQGQEAAVLAIVAVLFVVGGLGYLVLGDLWRLMRGDHGLSLHSRLVLIGTGALAVTGWAGIMLSEPLTPFLALFQALTPRTAGFDAVGAGDYGPVAHGLTIVLMFIGAGATSTAGGIKVATMMVLVLALWAKLRNRSGPRMGGVKLTPGAVRRVFALALAAVTIIAVGTGLMMLTASRPVAAVLFEAASAFGTAGLSTGVTEEADGLGRAVLMLLMFLGRIGPMTLAWLIVARAVDNLKEGEEDVPTS
ncbi:Ktr system potassium uptake protein B [Jannaschia seosinensis]|uniref:Ktr system potassium uptake protein B n=1 Tax=Jannaschia seosinensis TaxID=313367 RepID=A0A0M7BDM9_9RHOB|nr:potassium transporter TrkG [Jannaschia seosinensis]CUH39934.1 Ktr system potassium uptake protein B [Jannaschia seosinensis]